MAEKILLCSDTHGHIDPMALEIMEMEGLSRIIHLGDHARDADAMENLIGRTIIKVKGNNDFMSFDVPYDRVMTWGDHQVFLTHGHLYGVYYGLDRLAREAKSRDCDLAFFGHTHAFADEVVDGVRLINPGSCAWPRGGDGKKSFVILTLADDGKVAVDRKFL